MNRKLWSDPPGFAADCSALCGEVPQATTHCGCPAGTDVLPSFPTAKSEWVDEQLLNPSSEAKTAHKVTTERRRSKPCALERMRRIVAGKHPEDDKVGVDKLNFKKLVFETFSNS